MVWKWRILTLRVGGAGRYTSCLAYRAVLYKRDPAGFAYAASSEARERGLLAGSVSELYCILTYIMGKRFIV